MILLTIGKGILMAMLIWLGGLVCVIATKIVLNEMREMKQERKRRK